ncbi:MAG TPA: Ldh family oxidoreductase, partial [Burkholderiaceae bacterium]|nr:Ldh family oxidoreductase [Burkholderiaceae bacterium]
LVYLQKLKSGELNPRPQVRFDERHGVLHCFADAGLGQVIATRAVEQGLERAAGAGVVTVMLHDIGHLAALGMFTLQAAERGMAALLAQSTPPMMALPGSRGAAIGNNPLAFATAVAGGPPLVFDIAASAVARGNVLAAARDGRPIPADWAIDAHGNPTTDPHAALAGAMLPMAGHKGIGLAMMVECLAGSLAGARPAAVTGAAPGSAPARVGGFLLVINPDLVAGRDAYHAHLREWIGAYRSAAGEQARYPGERAARMEVERMRDGIPLPRSVVADLRKAGELAGTPFELRELDG